MVAASATPAVTGAISRTLKNADAKPVSASTPIWTQLVVALHRHQRAGGQRQEADDRDGAADERQAPVPKPIWAISRISSVR